MEAHISGNQLGFISVMEAKDNMTKRKFLFTKKIIVYLMEATVTIRPPRHISLQFRELMQRPAYIHHFYVYIVRDSKVGS